MAGLRWLRRRTRRQVLADVLVLAGLVAFVVLVYVVLVLGIGAVIGHTSSPDVALSVLATAVVALAFDPVQTRLDQAAKRVVNDDGQPSPYDVLRTFSRDRHRQLRRAGAAVADGPGAGRRHRSGVGAGVAGGRWTTHLAATWPPGAADETARLPAPDPRAALVVTDEDGSVRRSLPVLEAGELLGQLVVHERGATPALLGRDAPVRRACRPGRAGPCAAPASTPS